MKHITQATENRLNEMYNYIFGEKGENWEQYTNVRYMPRVYGEAIALYEMLNMAKCRLGWEGATVSEMKKYGELLDNHMSFSNVKKRYFETAVYAMKYHYEKCKYTKFSVYYVHTLDLDSGYIDGFNEIVKFVYNRFCAYVRTTVDPVTYYQDCIFGYVKNLPRWAKEAFEICGMLKELEELERKFAESEQEQTAPEAEQETPETAPEEQQAEEPEQTADNQTTEYAEPEEQAAEQPTAEQPTTEQQLKPRKPEMKLHTFKQLVGMLADDGTTAEKLDEIAALTDLSYQHDKITAKDHEIIYCIINKFDIIYNPES